MKEKNRTIEQKICNPLKEAFFFKSLGIWSEWVSDKVSDSSIPEFLLKFYYKFKIFNRCPKSKKK